MLGVVFFLLLVLTLSGCSNKNEVDLSDHESLIFDNTTIQPVSAKFDDGKVEITLKWSFGYDEDSMEEQSFASTGILIFAKQKDKSLTAGDLSESGIYTKVYETSESNIYPSFKLANKTDKIKVTLQKEGFSNKSESFEINIPN